MPEITLAQLRALRQRAAQLLGSLDHDLRAFLKKDGTFRRKPDSRDVAGDINVTTTCSCLMALATTHLFKGFYTKALGQYDPDVPLKILKVLIRAPWMSSGLADNNPFTTTLVLRAFGFLVSSNLLPAELAHSDEIDLNRPWENTIDIADPLGFGKTLHEKGDPTSTFLWLSLSDLTRDAIEKAIATNSELEPEGQRNLALDIRRIIESGWISGDKRFDKAAEATQQFLASDPAWYKLVTLNRQIISSQYSDHFHSPGALNLSGIANSLSEHIDRFAINNYPPSAAVIYWFVDGISRASIRLEEKNWTELCVWAAHEFNRTRSLVVSDHYAMMDPVAMGMAACLCARLRRLCDSNEPGTSDKHRSVLPSVIELDHAIGELIREQTKSGIWHKYFPLFHYQDAGSNFCFAFELLEALLCEFGRQPSKVMENERFVAALERAVDWCVANQLPYSELYAGWNSGGQLQSLEKGYPESWATAVVHMFLAELTEVVSDRIQDVICKNYRFTAPAVRPSAEDSAKSALEKMLDIDVTLPGEPSTLAKVLKEKIVNNYQNETPASLRRRALKKPLSALLFGPPGTSKTQVTKAVASDLGWGMISLAPSDFVKGTFAEIYVRANEIFEDLMDLSGVVVFFDEMDALVQTRDLKLDTASQFMTTMMLPKLQELHDQGRVVFFMATNFQDRFDPAIKRAGRFDLLLCMGPPSLDEKIAKLEVFIDRGDEAESPAEKESLAKELAQARDLIKQYYATSGPLEDRLALLTFGEFKTLVNSKLGGTAIGTKLQAMGVKDFKQVVEDFSSYATLKLEDLAPLFKDKPMQENRLADAYKLDTKDIEAPSPASTIIRYLLDRRESKDQS